MPPVTDVASADFSVFDDPAGVNDPVQDAFSCSLKLKTCIVEPDMLTLISPASVMNSSETGPIAVSIVGVSCPSLNTNEPVTAGLPLIFISSSLKTHNLALPARRSIALSQLSFHKGGAVSGKP